MLDRLIAHQTRPQAKAAVHAEADQRPAQGYALPQCRADAVAGLTVAVIALPLAMALAVASGASPDKGLITAIVAGLLISAVDGSRVQVGAFVVVIFNVIAQHGYDGLVLATTIAGLILVAAGYAGMGGVIRYILPSSDHRLHRGHCRHHRIEPHRGFLGLRSVRG